MVKERVAGEPKPRLIKLCFKVEDHVRLRLAAAMSDQAVGEFCRELVLAKALELTKGIALPAQPSNRSARRL